MSTRRLQTVDRVPSARPIGRARLFGYALRWTKVSKVDGSGKCHIEQTGNNADVVWGVLFEVPKSELRQLDRAEGRGYGYERMDVPIESADGPVTAMTYYATNINPSLKPRAGYKAYVLEGAQEHGLPAGYIETLRAIEVME